MHEGSIDKKIINSSLYIRFTSMSDALLLEQQWVSSGCAGNSINPWAATGQNHRITTAKPGNTGLSTPGMHSALCLTNADVPPQGERDEQIVA
ncbi:hypothetical protein ACVW0Y_004200 [Pseudomonas sp. TE3786]